MKIDHSEINKTVDSIVEEIIVEILFDVEQPMQEDVLEGRKGAVDGPQVHVVGVLFVPSFDQYVAAPLGEGVEQVPLGLVGYRQHFCASGVDEHQNPLIFMCGHHHN